MTLLSQTFENYIFNCNQYKQTYVFSNIIVMRIEKASPNFNV